MIDAATAAARIFDAEPDAEKAVEWRARLVRIAHQWLRADKPGTWDWWCSLNDETREAFAEAGDALWCERAAVLGAAIQSPGAALAPTDDGDTAIEDALVNAMNVATSKIVGGAGG